MKIPVTAIILSLLLCSTASAGTKKHVPWAEQNPNDKVIHFMWGQGTVYGVSSLAGDVPYSAEMGLLGALLTGVAKEMHDKNFDPYDFAATAGGGLIAYVAQKKVRIGPFAFTPSVGLGVGQVAFGGTF